MTTPVEEGVTTRERIEDALRESEDRFRNMADASPVMLWMSREDSLVTFFNQTWLDFSGRTLEQEWGIGWAEGVHPEDFQSCMDGYLRAFNEREVFEIEYRLRRADGEYRWISDRGTPRYTPAGSFAGYVGSCIDITDRRRMEVELRKAVRVREDFLAIASHELRTPLSTLRLRTDVLLRSCRGSWRESGVSTEDLLPKVESMAKQVGRLEKLISVLLDVSRIGAGNMPQAPDELDLCELVQEVVSRFQGCSSEEVRLRVPGELRGSWDRSSLDQVLTNILGNALKYGEGRPVNLTVERQDATARIEVLDHGIGIPAEDLERIFDRFERAAPGRQFSGLGLGLWISKQLVVAMGGRIDVASTVGQGSSFVVELPISDER